MEHIIYYFSGRGNSLAVAKGLAQRIPGACAVPMASVKGGVILGEGAVGIVTPVIDMGLPAYVRRFVGRMKCQGTKPYIYAVVTCGGMPGATLQALGALLRRRGLELSAGREIVFGLKPMAEDQWNAALDDIVGKASTGQRPGIPKAALKDSLMTACLNPLARLMIPTEDKKFRVAESCDGCGTCARACPAGNIEIVNGKPALLHRCEQCAACFSWCPKEAISGSCLAARTHYRNPGVALSDMTKSMEGAL